MSCAPWCFNSNEKLSTIVENSNIVSFTSKGSSILTSLLDYMNIFYRDLDTNISTAWNLYVIHGTHESPVTYYFKISPPSCLTININNTLNEFD